MREVFYRMFSLHHRKPVQDYNSIVYLVFYFFAYILDRNFRSFFQPLSLSTRDSIRLQIVFILETCSCWWLCCTANELAIKLLPWFVYCFEWIWLAFNIFRSNFLQIGGATALIGDPSGKSSERVALCEETVTDSSKVIAENIQRVFQNHQKYIWEKNRDPNILKPVK